MDGSGWRGKWSVWKETQLRETEKGVKMVSGADRYSERNTHS